MKFFKNLSKISPAVSWLIVPSITSNFGDVSQTKRSGLLIDDTNGPPEIYAGHWTSTSPAQYEKSISVLMEVTYLPTDMFPALVSQHDPFLFFFFSGLFISKSWIPYV